ncbi:MAG: diguanylate cyclase domain-containing protein, partial [Prochloraceae cyanobacterium]
QVSTKLFNLISQKEEFKSLLSQPEQIVSFRIDSSGRPCSLIPLPTVHDCYTVVAKTLFSYGGEPVAILLMGNSEQKMQIQLKYSLQQQGFVSILALLADIILALLLGRAIVKPIKNLQLTTQKFSNGNRQIRARVLSNDEIGQLTYHFNQMAQTIEVKEAELAEKSRQLEIHNLQLQLEIAERKKVEQKLEYNSLHDSLTGLANRVLFMERLSFAIAKLKRYPQIQHAVLFLDLDRFKPINDSFGHHYGDLLLIELTSRLKKCLRETDTLARLGGDEFTILLEDLQEPEDAALVARRINNEVAKPFYLCEEKIETTVSIGIALSDSKILYSPEQLLRHADLAMYRAKENGKNSYVVFDSTMAEKD